MGKKLDIDKATLLGLRRDGLSNKAIAKQLDISVQSVYRYIGPAGAQLYNFAEPEKKKARAGQDQHAGADLVESAGRGLCVHRPA